MAIFGKYTGQRIQPLPPGYIEAYTKAGERAGKGFAATGAAIGDAIKGYRKQKKEEQERRDALDAMIDKYTGDPAVASMIPQEATLSAGMDDAIATAVQNRTLAEDKALALGHIEKRQTAMRESSGNLMTQASQLNAEAEKLAAASRKPTPENQRRIDFLRAKAKRLGELEFKGRKAGKFSPARVKEMNALKERAAALEEEGSPLDPAFDELMQGVTRYGQESFELDEQISRAETLKADTIAQYAKPVAPITAATDEIYDKPWEYAEQQVTEEGQMDEELAKRIGPKLLKRFTAGESTKMDELLMLDTMKNFEREQIEGRTPKGQLTQLQLERLRGQVDREQQVGEVFDAISGLPTERTRLVPEKVTIDRLMQDVQSGKMTAAEAIQREEAMVDRVKRLGVSPQAGGPVMPPLPAGEDAGPGALVLRPPGPQYDYNNPDAYKINEEFQASYESLPDERQREIWEAEKANYTLTVPAAPAAPAAPTAPAAPPMEMEQQFERELPIGGAEQKQQAMDLLNRSGVRPGTAEYNAAVTEINRRYPTPLGAGYRVGQRTVSPSGLVTDVITPAPVSQYAPVPGAAGRYQLWVDGKPHGDPISFDNEYLSLDPQLQKVAEEMRMQILRDPNVKTYMESAAYAKSVKRLVAKMDNGKPGGIATGEYTASDDVALIFQFMKALDPTSVVRESEYATAQNTGGIPEIVYNLFNKANDGTFLTPEQRMNFAATVDTVSAGYRESALSVVDEFETQAVRRKIPAKFVVPDMFRADHGPNVRTPSRYGPPPAFIRGKGGKLQPAPRD